MKHTLIYIISILIIIILLPFIIIKGLGSPFLISQQPLPKSSNPLAIKVFDSFSKKTIEMDLDEYVKGVVAAEMPAAFEPEALKAQAIAARTYVLGRYQKLYIPKKNIHSDADVCTDPAHCQAWVNKETAMKKWSFFQKNMYWKKVSDAVDSTSKMIITYDKTIINPLYHACSPQITEDAKNLWDGKEFPYLKSVSTEGDEKSPVYKTIVDLNLNDFVNEIKKAYPDYSRSSEPVKNQLKILEKTSGDRVKEVEISKQLISGSAFRALFNLNSTCFNFEYPSDEKIRIVVTGSGHGAGMSQWGANGLALEGGSFEEILKHYYTGVEITKF